MLTSSDAKWRCLWHMFVWSVLLTLVSQFLELADHVAFWIFALVSILILPVVTAVYSNTAGRHGAGFLRASYVFCDPVLVSLAITPVLLLNHLPVLVDRYICFQLPADSLTPNFTYSCLVNSTDGENSLSQLVHEPSPEYRARVISVTKKQLMVVQVSVIMPVLLALLMGKRTRKMRLNTHLLCVSYWLVVALEATDLIQISLLHTQYKHIIYTSEATVTIVMIITNSYAVVTLCSYISPLKPSEEKKRQDKFDMLYKMFVALAAIFFVEIPLLVSRLRILAINDLLYLLPGTFYFWFIKDMVFIPLIVVAILTNRFGHHFSRLPCQPALLMDSPDVFFVPEKRDEYIVNRKRVRFEEPPALVTMYPETDSSGDEAMSSPVQVSPTPTKKTRDPSELNSSSSNADKTNGKHAKRVAFSVNVKIGATDLEGVHAASASDTGKSLLLQCNEKDETREPE